MRPSGLLVAVGEAEAAPCADVALHLDGAVDVERADLLAGIEHLDVVLGREVAGGHGAGPLGLERDGLGVARIGLEQDALEVEDDVGDILGATLDRAELVIHALDLDRRNGGALDGREQDAAKRVADRARIADFERFRRETGVRRGRRGFVLLDALRHFEAAQTDRHWLPPCEVVETDD